MDPKRALAKSDAASAGFLDVMGDAITPEELLFLLSVAQHETACGDSWKDVTGNPLHNWGAVQWRKPDAQEELRIAAGDLVKGSTIPGGVLERDSSPAKGPYWVWFRTSPNDRVGAGVLVTTLYKHDPACRTAAAACNITAGVTAMYVAGYYEGVHKGARPVGLRKLPLNAAEQRNVDDYMLAVNALWAEWQTALGIDVATPVTSDPVARRAEV